VKKPGQSSEPLSVRVRRTLEDLAVIQKSLKTTAAQPDGEIKEPNPLLDLELAAELKSVVDILRNLLWSYISVLSARSGRRPQEVLDWYKMELAVEMLRNASSRLPATEPKEADGSLTFEEIITRTLAVTAMHTGQERHV
jgi:hypothetical protein